MGSVDLRGSTHVCSASAPGERVILSRDKLSPSPHPSVHSLVSATQMKTTPHLCPHEAQAGFQPKCQEPPKWGTSYRLGVPEVALNWSGVWRVGKPEMGACPIDPAHTSPDWEALGTALDFPWLFCLIKVSIKCLLFSASGTRPYPGVLREAVGKPAPLPVS